MRYFKSVLILPIIMALLLFTVNPSIGGVSAENEGGLDDESLLLDFYPDILVVVITELDKNSKNTNEAPPRITVEIKEVLKGSTKEVKVEAIWRPYPHDVDWVGQGSKEAIKEWSTQPNVAPKIGTKWILSGVMTPCKVFNIAPRGKYLYTDDKLKWVKSILQSAKKRP